MGARDASGRGGEVAGHSVARRHRARFGGSDRLRLPRAVDRSADRETPPGLGVRDGAAVLAAHVCPAGAAPGPARVDGGARRGLPLLRRGPAPTVPDNLKTGVDKLDLYDPKINKAYAELATHYGALVDPARAAKPKDKPRVERPMPYVRDSFWRGGSSPPSSTCRPRP